MPARKKAKEAAKRKVKEDGDHFFKEPERNSRALQYSVNYLLRMSAAYRAEGDLCCQLEKNMAARFQRGEERAAIDLGLSVNDKILGIEIKSFALAMQHPREGGNNGLSWRGEIIMKQGQMGSDIVCVSFPNLQNRQWVMPLLDKVSSGPDALRATLSVRYSAAGRQIETVVPPYFWSRMISMSDFANVLSQFSAEAEHNDPTEGFPIGAHAAQKL